MKSAIAIRHVGFEDLSAFEAPLRTAGYAIAYRDIGTDDLTAPDIAAADLLAAIDIPPAKEIRDCSSGMKQRMKLALAYYTKSDILLLDEPTANMDHHWRDWTNALVKNDPQQRIVIICSNEEYEYEEAKVAVTL